MALVIPLLVYAAVVGIVCCRIPIGDLLSRAWSPYLENIYSEGPRGECQGQVLIWYILFTNWCDLIGFPPVYNHPRYWFSYRLTLFVFILRLCSVYYCYQFLAFSYPLLGRVLNYVLITLPYFIYIYLFLVSANNTHVLFFCIFILHHWGTHTSIRRRSPHTSINVILYIYLYLIYCVFSIHSFIVSVPSINTVYNVFRKIFVLIILHLTVTSRLPCEIFEPSALTKFEVVLRSCRVESGCDL